MRYGVLGPTLVRGDDGREVPVAGAGLRALLARLLLDPGRVVSTDRLLEDLYGDRPPAGAGNALQSQVSRLRRALRQPALVEAHPAGYRLAVDPGDVDAHRFTRLADAGRRALAAGDVAGAARLLTEALADWRGPALADVPAPFATARVAHLEELRLAAVADRVEAHLALGEAEPLVPELRALVAEHPLRERLRALLMRALYGSGRAAEALAEYEDARRRLAEELGADPSSELAEVHLAILRADPPPARPRLPAQLTSFVGRDEELRRVGKLLAEARLVTITGPGGAGKTRLAIEAAAQQPDEASFVDLAPLVAGADLPQAVLAGLGLRDAGLRSPTAEPPDPLGRLVSALADRRMLLLLDNCEHVVGATAGLADRLLRDCPQLRILATSREPLGLTGEALWPLSGLAEAASVRLFRDRAADVAPGTALDDETVRRICRTLDGLPLAIELAAARLRSLPLPEIAARLDDRFRLLSRGSRTAQPRHQTLRAVVGWSWELLDPAERALAARLTVFAGGASLAAVRQVCGAEEALELLASLVDKSLVEAADGRYRMLETIRAYGAERLAEAGEAGRLRAAHTAYFLQLAQTADPHLRRAEQLEWLARLDTERDNLHAAVRRAAAAGDAESGLRLVAALSFYWWLRGLRGEAATLAAGVLAVAGGEPPAGLTEEYALCVLTASLGGTERDQHQRVAAAAATVYQLHRPPRQPFLYFLSGMATGPPGDGLDGVRALQQRQEALLIDDPWARALGPVGLALVRAWAGDLAQAEREATVALERFRELGERWGMTVALSALAEFAGLRGEHARAAGPMAEALRLAGELESTVDVADLLRVRAEGRLSAGDLTGAEADYRRAEALARRAGALELRAAALLGLAEVARRRGELAEARRLVDAALAECPTGWFSADETRASGFVTLGQIAEAEGDRVAARTAYRRALPEHDTGRLQLAAAEAREALARLAAPSAGGA